MRPSKIKKEGSTYSTQRKKIKHISDKRAEELKIYRHERDKYMAIHVKCECGCGKDSQDLHHKNGRLGKMVYNVYYFMAVTRECHDRIHNNPEWARKKGYLI